MKNLLLISILLFVGSYGFGQEKELNIPADSIIKLYGIPDEIEIISPTPIGIYYQWKYSNDTVVRIFKDTALNAYYNYTISEWERHMNAISSGGRAAGYIADLTIKISPIGDYHSGKPIILNVEISNETNTILKYQNNDTYYYNFEKNGSSYISGFITDTNYMSLCKHPWQWGRKNKEPTKSDFISLKPGDKITKEISLTRIVYDCICEEKLGIKKGYYRIGMRYLFSHSNVLTIEVK